MDKSIVDRVRFSMRDCLVAAIDEMNGYEEPLTTGALVDLAADKVTKAKALAASGDFSDMRTALVGAVADLMLAVVVLDDLIEQRANETSAGGEPAK